MCAKKRLPLERRLEAVKAILYEAKSCEEAAEECGCGLDTVYTWLLQYGDRVRKEHPRRPLNRHWNGREISRQMKDRAVRLYLSGQMNSIQIAKVFGLVPSTVMSWVNGKCRDTARTERKMNQKAKPKKGKLTPEQQFKIAKSVLKGGKPVVIAALESGMTIPNVRQWVEKYKGEILGGK